MAPFRASSGASTDPSRSWRGVWRAPGAPGRRWAGRALVGPVVALALAWASLPALAQDADALARLSDALATHDSFKVRATAAVALGRLGDPSAVAPLSRAVTSDRHFAVRAAAASALGRIASPEGVPALLQALGDDDAFVTKEAARALERHHEPRHLAAFQPALGSGQRDVRLAAVEAYGEVLRGGLEEAASAVVEALADEDEEIRKAASQALDRVPHDRVLPILLSALENGGGDVRAAAAEMLGRRADERSVAPLLAALGRLGEQESVRKAIRSALKAHESYIDLDRAYTEAASGNPEQKVSALRLVAAVGDEGRALPLLAAGLVDPSRDVRTAAARGAADIGSPKARQLLEGAAHRESDPRVKRHIELLLRTLR